MIVDTMTLQEVGETILKTAIRNIPTIGKLIMRKDKVYKRIIYKGQKERYDFLPMTFEADGIEFHICPYSKGKSDYKKYGIANGLFAHIFYRRTNWYCLITYDYQSVVMYSNHFFERYIERHLKDSTQVNAETVRRYFKETDYLTMCQVIDNPKYKNCIYGSTNIGVCCGEIVSSNVKVFKTFIDMETLTQGDKKETFDSGQTFFANLITNKLGIREFKGVA